MPICGLWTPAMATFLYLLPPMVSPSSNRPHRHDLPSWRPCTYAQCPRLPVYSVCDSLGQTDHIQRYDGQPSSESAASPASACRPGSRAQASYSGFFSFQYLRPMWPHRWHIQVLYAWPKTCVGHACSMMLCADRAHGGTVGLPMHSRIAAKPRYNAWVFQALT